MPTLESKIIGVIVVGDDVSIRRIIDRSVSGFTAGTTITKAWLTVKLNAADADPGLFQKLITTTNVVGVGHIENDGTGDVDPIIRFDLLPADTVKIGATLIRQFDIQVKTNGGQIYTPERGTINAVEEVTLATT